MFIQISTTNRCILGCSFCFGKYPRIAEDMPFSIFKKAIRFYCKGLSRISNIDLTPVVGEFFIKDRIKELQYIEDRKKIERYDVVTNLLEITDKEIDFFLASKKNQLFISIYGHDELTYKRTTGKNLYRKFIERLRSLYTRYLPLENPPKLIFYMRHDKFRNIPITSEVFKIIKGLMVIKEYKISIDESTAGKNDTWAGQLEVENPEPTTRKMGGCLHSIVKTAVLPDGNITLCGLVDYKKKMIIGTINQRCEEVYGPDSKYREIIEKQRMGVFPELCQNCNEYEYYKKDMYMLKNHINKNKVLEWL